MKPLILAGKMRHLIKVQKPVADGSFDGAGSGNWADLIAEPFPAEVQDMLPSRGEKIADGLTIATRPSRIRMRYRSDVKANMRVLIGETVAGVWQTYRTTEIVSPPAELGFSEGLEFMVEDYSTAGSSA